MEKFIINGGNQLNGTIQIETSKNATLPILAASVLTDQITTINKLPKFSDIENMLKILESIGAKVSRFGESVTLDCSSINTTDLPLELSSKIRASVFLMGPLLAKHKRVLSPMPGGCKIGKRPIDIHLSGFTTLGVKILETDNQVICDASNFIGGEVNLRFPSVGATENLIMCSVLSNGVTTVIKNCAKEPEIVDLCNFIIAMGGNITGQGTDVITIVGVNKLNGVNYTPIPDRIIEGTYLIATAVCGGNLKITNSNGKYNKSLITLLLNLGCTIRIGSDNIYISSNKILQSEHLDIVTEVYPGFATDLQAQTMAMLTLCNGTYTIEETLFESRFKQVDELVKMGAQITIDGNRAIICGKPDCLKGTVVTSWDLRGGASLVIAGLAAKGTTVVENIEYIDRGYEKLEEKLTILGANIHRKS